MAKKKPNYFSFLLRLWTVSDEAVPSWRASLEDSHTGERIGFATLDELSAYLGHEKFVKVSDNGDENESTI
jgi:hypothetical protein